MDRSHMVPVRRLKRKKRICVKQCNVKYIDFSNMGSTFLTRKKNLKPNGQSLKDNFRSVFPKNGYKNDPKWAPPKDRTE